MIKTCEYCSKEFSRRGRNAISARFCSYACKSASSNAVNKECTVCGTTFRAHGEKSSTAKYCSQACKGIASRLPVKDCGVCGKTFKPRMGCADQPTCSRECGAIYRKTGNDASCEQCGTSFYVTKSRADAARFCSNTCQNAWQGKGKIDFTCKICGSAFKWSPSRKDKYNVTYCSILCRDADPDRRAMLIAMNVAQAKMRPNNLERQGYAMLDAIGVEYEQQHLIGGKFCVDAFVPSTGVVIQFDGDYWHGNPERFPEPDARQRRRMKLDSSQDAYMAACGYQVLRLWESHFKNHPEQVAALVRDVLAEAEHQSSRRTHLPSQ